MYENIDMISCGNTNCYVIRGCGGDILIDTGEERSRNEIEMWLLNYDVKIIVLTHGHNDHIGNAAYFSELFGAEIYINKADYPLISDNLKRHFYTSGALGRIAAAMSKKTMEQKAEKFKVTRFVSDGDVIGSKYGIPCFIVGLDGHTKGSVGVYFGDDLYVGDAVMNVPYPSFPYICESPKAARATIDKINVIRPKRIMCGHGDIISTEHNKAYANLFSRSNIL